MNALYHLAIIEGFLAQQGELPKTIQASLQALKDVSTPPVAEEKKKRRISRETRERLRAQLAKGREVAAQNRANRVAGS